MSEDKSNTCGYEMSLGLEVFPELSPKKCPAKVSHETSLLHDFWAEADQYRRGWIAKFQMPQGGVKYVRDNRGCVIVFDDQREAERSAKRAFLSALDGGGRQPIKGKQIFVRKAHGRRRYALLGA